MRQGFRIVALDGQEATLAHIDMSSPYRVSKYRVDIDALDRVGVSALRQAVKEAELIVVDEIGKMELLSPRFKEAVTQALNSGKRVLGTIMLDPHPFVDEIKRRPQVEVFPVTRDNRTDAMKKVLNWVTEVID